MLIILVSGCACRSWWSILIWCEDPECVTEGSRMCYNKNSTEYWFLVLMDEYAVLAATSHHLDWVEFSLGAIYFFFATGPRSCSETPTGNNLMNLPHEAR